MCMLIHHTPKAKVTREMLKNFLRHNGDGFGFVSHDGKKLHCLKLPVAGYDDVAALYDQYIRGREAIIHFRMRTHGDINRENTHPYNVMDGLWMAHNGVLNNVTQRDRTMSDTWHLIEDYLRPMLAAYPDLLQTAGFQKMLGAFIGSSNKLGFMDKRGRVVVINRAQGIEHAGAWYSNEYAWDPELFIPGYKSRYSNSNWWKDYPDQYGTAMATVKNGKVTVSGNVAAPVATPKNGNVAAPATLTKKQRKLLKKQRRQDALLRASTAPKAAAAKATVSLREDDQGRVWMGGGWADKSHLRSAFRDRTLRAAGPSGPTLDPDGLDPTERLLSKHDVQ